MNNIAVILTVFNKEALIERVIKSIAENSSELVKEIVLVFDSCTDHSEFIVRSVLQSYPRYNPIYTYIEQGFETRSNNLGLKSASCDYSILFQDDMIINEKDYDKRLLTPFLHFNDILAVTARSAHNDSIINNAFCYTDFFDKDHGSPRNFFGVRDVVNRGPLMVNQEKIGAMNYFDEAFCPQSYDDHDLCFRAFINHGWVCGSFWTDYVSNPEWGTSRQFPYAPITTVALMRGEQLIKNRYLEFLKPDRKHNEERELS